VPIGGLLLGIIGPGIGAVILNGTILFSSLFLFLGIITTNFSFIMASRLLLGLGAELI